MDVFAYLERRRAFLSVAEAGVPPAGTRSRAVKQLAILRSTYYSRSMLMRANLYKSLQAYKRLFLGPHFFIYKFSK